MTTTYVPLLGHWKRANKAEKVPPSWSLHSSGKRQKISINSISVTKKNKTD